MGDPSGSGCGLAFGIRKPWAQPRRALRSRINLKLQGLHTAAGQRSSAECPLPDHRPSTKIDYSASKGRPLPAANARDNPSFADSLLAPARSSNMSYAVSGSLLAIARIPATDGRAWGPGAPTIRRRIMLFLFSAKPQ